jgi:uroporphyrin-III C-methyltransferase/precorrin-2 dehydrogenase/sirohydrochlorin ferrochelatase
MDYLPIFIQLRGSPAVVVGGGKVALRKADLLLKAGARITVIAPKLHDDCGRSQSAGSSTTSRRVPAHHLDGTSLVIAARTHASQRRRLGGRAGATTADQRGG